MAIFCSEQKFAVVGFGGSSFHGPPEFPQVGIAVVLVVGRATGQRHVIRSVAHLPGPKGGIWDLDIVPIFISNKVQLWSQ